MFESIMEASRKQRDARFAMVKGVSVPRARMYVRRQKQSGHPNARIPEKHVRSAADKGSARVRLSASRARFVCPRAYFIERVI